MLMRFKETQTVTKGAKSMYCRLEEVESFLSNVVYQSRNACHGWMLGVLTDRCYLHSSMTMHL